MRKYVLIAVGFVVMTLQAQTTKPITLSDKTPFIESITLTTPAGDVDVNVKFLFREDSNTVTLAVTSDRKLFVFWNDIKYRKAFSCRKLRTDRLPYALIGNTSDEFSSARRFRKALPKPRCSYLFHTWLTAEGMQAKDTERKIVNDSLVQVFTLTGTGKNRSIRLRDLLFIDEVKQKGAVRFYELTFGGDINTVYAITLQHNPCSSLNAEKQAAENALAAIQRSYQSFKSIYAKGVVNSEEGAQMFNDLQEALQTQFPLNQDSSACPAIQQLYDRYNQTIDSIRALSVQLNLPADEANLDCALNAKTILANARLIDNNVARWLVSTDKMERSDLINQCRTILSDTNEMITKNAARTQEERDAVAVFRKAEQYFKRTCR